MTLNTWAETTWTYDYADGLLASQTDPLNHTTEYTYDTAQNLTSVTNGEDETTEYTYNTAGDVLTVTDGASAVTEYTY